MFIIFVSHKTQNRLRLSISISKMGNHRINIFKRRVSKYTESSLYFFLLTIELIHTHVAETVSRTPLERAVDTIRTMALLQKLSLPPSFKISYGR